MPLLHQIQQCLRLAGVFPANFHIIEKGRCGRYLRIFPQPLLPAQFLFQRVKVQVNILDAVLMRPHKLINIRHRVSCSFHISNITIAFSSQYFIIIILSDISAPSGTGFRIHLFCLCHFRDLPHCLCRQIIRMQNLSIRYLINHSTIGGNGTGQFLQFQNSRCQRRKCSSGCHHHVNSLFYCLYDCFSCAPRQLLFTVQRSSIQIHRNESDILFHVLWFLFYNSLKNFTY